jgi:hypothetical protein
MPAAAQQLMRGAARCLCVLLLAALAGCVSAPPPSQRLARYVPETERRDVWDWQRTLDAYAPGAVDIPESGLPAEEPAEAYVPPAPERESKPWETRGANQGSWPLRRGDRIAISLRGIPEPEEIMEVVDDYGEITLPLIGNRRVEGMRTLEAERMLTETYVREGFYQEGKLTVILVAQDNEYFVRGEVKGPGRYTLSGDLTLLQAIASAGGYTDYARMSKIRVIRDTSVLVFDAARIERRRDEDPDIKPGDIIVVPRKIF